MRSEPIDYSKAGRPPWLPGSTDSQGQPRPERGADRTPDAVRQPRVSGAHGHAGANSPPWAGSGVLARTSLSPPISGPVIRADLSPRHTHALPALTLQVPEEISVHRSLAPKAFSSPPNPLLGAASSCSSRPVCLRSANRQLPALPAATHQT